MPRVVSGSFGTYVLSEPPRFTGGNAQLFAVEGKPDLLCKVFHTPLAGDHVTRVTELVEVGLENRRRNGISRAAQRIAWPLDLSVEYGAVTGVLIPLAGEAFFRQTPGGPLAQNFGYLAGGQQLPTVTQRLLVIRQLAGALAVLERLHLVHGDVSSTNMLCALKPDPQLLLVDCDGIHRSDFVTEPFYTDFWKDPRLDANLIPCHDTQSDWYALALAVYRVLVANARATPGARDFTWIREELPWPIAKRLVQVFAAPRDGKVRVPPTEWKTVLGNVIGNQAECERLAQVTRDRPDSVGGRRGSAEDAQPGGATPRPRVPRPAPLPSDPPRHAARPRGAPSRANKRLLRLKRLLLSALLAASALMGVYHFEGIPNWPVLNQVNDLLLSGEQRQLIAKLPPQIWDCRDYPLEPVGATATITCRWEEREFIAVQFSSAQMMHAFYDQRAAIARRAMAGKERPVPCPTGGEWHQPGDSRDVGGDATSFVYSGGARVDWSSTASLIYRIGLASPSELQALCGWWIRWGDR